MKRIMSIFLAVLMLSCLCLTAFASEATPEPTATPAPIPSTSTTTITVNDDRTYEVYQIFTGDLAAGTVLSNIKWGKNGTGTEGEAVGKDVLTALENVKNESDVNKLATIKTYVSTTKEEFGTVSKNSPLTVAPGYYLLKDVTSNVPNGQEHSAFVVEVVGPLTVTAKAGEVTSDKKVKDKDDTTGVESDWQDSASYDIGDVVPFKLSATITTKYDAYDSYYLAFHDKLSTGLSFNSNSVVVKVGNTTIDSSKYEVVTSDLETGCTFEVRFANLKNVTEVTAGSTITVEYNATLTSGATVGSAGNTNTMYVEYSNNPTQTGSGDRDTGKTPEDTVIVFTYKLIVNKKDDNDNALTGAGFTLYKKIKDTSTEGFTWQQVGNEVKGTDMTQFTWTGIDAGDYKLVETTTPAGYNTMADILFTVADTKDTTSVSPTLTALTSVITGKSDTFGTTDVTAGTITADITNNKGTILPETGSTGTMMFITVGSILVMAAGVFMVVRKKMSVYED